MNYPEEEVAARLRGLAAHDRGAQAPPRVEAALLAALRERGRRAPRRAPIARWAFCGLAAAAAVVIAIAIAPDGNPALPTLPRPQAPAAPAIAFMRPPAALPPVRVAAARRPAASSARLREVVTPFYPVQYGLEASDDSIAIVRMALPRATLSSFGLPVNPNRLSELVQADVVFGNGGAARAIRFVRPAPVYSRPVSLNKGEAR